MNTFFQHIPLGEFLPQNNPHAVSVSLPKLADVIGYEENLPEVINQMQNGYPRFFKNKLVKKLEEEVRQLHNIANENILIPITSIKAKNILEEIFGETFPFVEFQETCFLVLPEDKSNLDDLEKMIRHLGAIISSRKAENILFEKHLIHEKFQEEKSETELPEKEIKKYLAQAYHTKSDTIFLTNSGTNAVFATLEALTNIKKSEGKTMNVQLGWLYTDTIEIIKKRSTEHFVQIHIHDKDYFENWLEKNHSKVANMIAETVSNPLLQCIDIIWLSEICKKYHIGLVLDNTMATPFSADVLKYCDVAVESLTKFACGNADVLMGAVVINENSEYCEILKQNIGNYLLPPFEEDLKRLGYEIEGYETRMQKISENTFTVFEYLKKQDFVKEIHSVYEEKSWENFQKIRKNHHHIGLLSVVFKKPLAECYDILNFAKGPSLGTEFTLAMPYTYLAHYDLIKTEEGRKQLEKDGLHPEILRISIGTEPVNSILEEFEKLKKSFF